MKKILLISIIFLFLGSGLTPLALAATDAPAQLSPKESGFVPIAPIPGLTEGGAATSGNLAEFFNNLYKYLIGLAAVLAIVEIIWGGLEYATQDIPGAKKEGKEKIQQAILGLILVLSPALVFSIINPSILDLSLNLPPLKLTVPITFKPSAKDSFNSSYPCSASGDCTEAQASCKSAGGSPEADKYCATTNGVIDPEGRRVSVGSISCIDGEIFVVKCVAVPADIKDNFAASTENIIECSSTGDCTEATAQCKSQPNSGTGETVCLINHTTVDPKGKKFSFVGSTSCEAGETVGIKCIKLK